MQQRRVKTEIHVNIGFLSSLLCLRISTVYDLSCVILIFNMLSIIVISISLVLNQDTNKRFQEQADIVDNNQKILLSITEFLPRVCILASESMGMSVTFVALICRLL